MSKKNKVIVMRGISGAGKSTWIKDHHPKAFVCSADKFFIDESGKYNFDPTKLSEAHKWCLKKFSDYITNSIFQSDYIVHDFPTTVIVDNTNTMLWEMSPYVSLATAYDWDVEIVRLDCDVDVAAQRNVHGVPVKSVKDMKKRFQKCLPWWNEKVIDTNP